MQPMTRDSNDIKCHFRGRVGHFKIKCPLRVKQQQENDGQQPQQRDEQPNNPRRQHQQNRGRGRGPVWCSYHKAISHSDADSRTRGRKLADGNAHVAATGPSRIKEFAALTTFQNRATSRNTLTSPSRPRRYIPRRQLPRGKATMRKPSHSAHC